MFKIWLDHGKSPKNANYDYIVVPGVDENALADDGKIRKEINILANNGKMQAVENKALKVLQVIFYEPGELKAKDWSVKVDQPCVVMINAKDKNKCSRS